jgi:hypothetical protein
MVSALNRWIPGGLMRLSFGVNATYPDDIYIVSYPRSGNTWTRYIMAYLKAGVCKPLTSLEVDRFAPDIYTGATNANLDTSMRVIKTHVPMMCLYPRVVFVHRDPRESLVSFWHYSLRVQNFSGTFSQFIRSSVSVKHGSWKEHMQAMQWKVETDPKNIHVMRYDALQGDFQNTVSGLIEWCGFGSGVDLDVLKDLTSMETMASSDADCPSPFRSKSGESFFVDRGKGSDWRSVWTQSDMDWLLRDREMVSIMEQYGYR